MKKLIALLLAMVLCLGLFAGCGGAEEKSDLAKAREYLYSLYVDKSTETATDLEYPARVKGGNTFFDVEWTVTIVSGNGEIKVVNSENEGFVVVDVPGEPAEDIVYKLTATIKDPEGKKNETLEYTYTVPQFKLTSFSEYAAAADDTLLVCQGVVTAILSKTLGDSSNSLYFQDNDGGYYAYNITADPVEAGIEVGMTVRVTGLKDTYNGTYEIVSGEAQIIDSAKKPATPADWTEIFQNAADLKDASLTTLQSFLVTIKGVEITKQDDKYLKFKLGDKETYIYISSSNCPGTADEEAAMIAEYNEKSGYLANVTGLVTLYNGSFYLTPCGPDAFEYLGLPEKSDEEKVAFEKGNLDFSSSVSQDTEIELPATGATFADVTISWSVEGEGAAIVDGKLVLTVGGEDSVVTVTATLTAGSAAESVSFEIKIRGNATNTTITQTDSIANGDKIVIYYPDSSLVLSGEDDGKKVIGVEAVLDGTTLTAPDAAYIDVVVDENGYYTFLCDGKYLTAGATGNSLVWAAEASEFSLWTLVAAEGGYYIQSVNAAYNGNPQYLEYYSNFTTYGFNETKANIYLFQFFLVTEEAAGLSDGKQVIFYNAENDTYVTGEEYLYTSSSGSTKNELVMGAEDAALVLTVKMEGDYVSFVTADGKYLMADGKNVDLVDEAGEHTLFVLEEVDGGYLIRCANATYNDKPQYLEVYSGYLTVYSFNESKVGIYTFELIVK